MKVKYEIKILTCMENYLWQFNEAQNEGWELAGQIYVFQHHSSGMVTRIPLKRKIKQPIPKRTVVISDVTQPLV